MQRYKGTRSGRMRIARNLIFVIVVTATMTGVDLSAFAKLSGR
jgi:hypothetical protein